MMNKTILCIAMSSAALLTSTGANAVLPSNALLNFDAGVLGGIYGNVIVSGSYFAMDTNGDGSFQKAERTGISQNNGIFLGTIQAASGSHTGAPDGSEAADIDSPWGFFGNTGMHQTTSATTILSATGNTATVDFSGWSVTWNGIPDIPMGSGDSNGVASITCPVDCADGDTYSLDYFATVPLGDPSGFGGVKYTIHLEGTISLQPVVNSAPVANDDAKTVDRKATGRPYTANVLDIVANDTDINGIPDIDRTTVTADTTLTGGMVVIDPVSGNVTYTPVDDFLGTDTFTYTVMDKGGPAGPGNELTSNIATVTFTVQNALPVAADDNASLDTSSTANVQIDVTSNDTDSDGTINPASVNILPANDAANGTTSIDPVTGAITYTPDAGFVGTDTFKYSVEDNDMATSNLATVVVVVSSGTGVLPDNAFLILNAGTGVPGEGSYFTMEVNPGKLTFVGITGFDHVQLGVAQPASAAMPSIDEPWLFFGNLGIHQTTSPITILTDDGNGNVTFDFSGWDVSWNSIPSIPLDNGDDHGIAAMTCAIDCSNGDTFSLIYRATVPPGDPSGFGGVHYILHMDGVISDKPPTVGGGNIAAPYRVTDAEPIVAVDDSTSGAPNPVSISGGSVAVSAGKPTGANLTAEEVGIKDPALNPKDGKQCIGGCVDFVATGVANDFIDLAFKLNEPLPSGAVYRKLINNRWIGFDTSGSDQLGTANADASGNCQGPEGKYNTGLREGASCIFLRIYDGGPNDADGAKNGTIVDPSGALLAGSSNVPSSSTSGCSISSTPVAIQDRADWLLVAAFISILGFLKARRKNNV